MKPDEWWGKVFALRLEIQGKENEIAKALFNQTRGVHGISTAKKVLRLAGDLVQLETEVRSFYKLSGDLVESEDET